MAVPTLTPTSATSVSILPSTGSTTAVNTGCPFGIYSDSSADLYSTDFISGAVDQVAYTYRKLGGDVLDIELVPNNIYAAYEEATLEYSYILNMHQAKNILSDVLGNSTGTFDHDGTLKTGALKTSLSGTHIALKYPKFDFAYARRVADGISAEVGMGGADNEYSASFTVTSGVQDYNLQSAISQSSTTASLGFGDLVGNKKILVKKVYYKTPSAMWRFFGFFGGLNVVGNMSSYGQFGDSTEFQVVPVWQNRLQSMAYEDAIHVRNSHYSYELVNNKLRLFPAPTIGAPSKMWIKFSIPSDGWTEDSDKTIGVDGINNLGTIPLGNLPYANINAIGKQFIRKFALACSKETLGQIRGKFDSVPIPNNSVTLNADALLAQAEKEKDDLRTELKEILEATTYNALAKDDAELVEETNKVISQIPPGIYVG